MPRHPTAPTAAPRSSCWPGCTTHLTRLLAPIIPHTAEESWDYRPAAGRTRSSVHLAEFPEPDPRWDDEKRDARWDELIALREQVLVALEGLRKEQAVSAAPRRRRVRIATARPERWQPDRELLATLCIVSEVEIVADPAAAGEAVQAERPPTPSASGAGITGPASG